MDHASPARHQENSERSDFDRRYERLGEIEGDAGPKGSGRPRRTIEECIRETAEHRRSGISVICRPTWETLEQARDEIKAHRSR